MISQSDFTKLMEHSEDDFLDWKSNFPRLLIQPPDSLSKEKGKAELLKDIIAIANGEGLECGWLIVGVTDKKTSREIFGITFHIDDADIQTWLRNIFSPVPNVLFYEIEIDNKRVGIFEIHRIPQYPHVVIRSIGDILYDGQIWYRQKSQNRIAHLDEIKRMINGEDPILFSRYEDGVLTKAIETLNKNELMEIIFPSYRDLDKHLEIGYEIAFYPQTRRRILIGNSKSNPDNIAMYRPRIKR